MEKCLPLAPMQHPELERYRLDRSPQAAERLIEHYYPLVRSVCRRYLRHSQDAEDATQETFYKLLRNVDTINTDLQGWLTTTAYSCSIDLIRRSTSNERRSQALRQMGTHIAEHCHLHETIQQRLHEALLQLDARSRELIVDRFVRKTPLRVIAGELDISPATASRRVTQAISDLATTLRDMGVHSADDLSLLEHFGDPSGWSADSGGADQLRFAPDWRLSQWTALGNAAMPAHRHLRQGWTRPIRVGVFVSYLSDKTVAPNTGIRGRVEKQVSSTCLLTDPGFQLIGIVESGTSEYGPIERTLRDHDITAGLIDASDLESLKTLDVLWLGTNFAAPLAALAAFTSAVRSGVGLLNEHWLSGMTCHGDFPGRELMLADSIIYRYHTKPRCGVPGPMTVLSEDPLLPGLSRGTRLIATGCGSLFRPMANARVIIAQDHVIEPEEHGIPGLGAARIPSYIIGQLGLGRAVVSQLPRHQTISQHPSIAANYLADLLAWLAEPRRSRLA